MVVERKDTFYLNPFNLRLLAGEVEDRSAGERALSGLARKGIEWVHGEILGIDPKARTVSTSSGMLDGDYLIVALGAEKEATGIPGFAESAYNIYEPEGAMQARTALQQFDAGRAVVLCSFTPFSCPAAPYEAAFLMDSVLRAKGNRQRVEIAVYTPEGRPMAAAGPAVGDAVIGMMKERDINYFPKHQVQRIDGDSRKLVFAEGDASFDLLLGVPPHAAPRVVREAGLTDKTGWIPVELNTLETSYPGVYAIGDVTFIQQPNPTGLPLPKAGIFADEESRVVARNIAAQIAAEEQSSKFDGEGFCYIEAGGGQAAYGSGNFYAYPAARVYLEPPTEKLHQERKQLELDQLETLV